MFGKRADTAALGREAERQAEQYLTAKGLQLVERNYRCKCGEIDLVMREANCLVFVEVRHRRSAQYGSAVETVTAAKQRKLIATARHYCVARRLSERQAMRFDVVGVTGASAQGLQWLPHAFDGF